MDAAQFVARFEANVVKGCLANSSQGVRNPKGYCSCYAAAFAKRYSPQEIAAITRLAGQWQQAPTVIALMMSPEIRACRQAN